MSDPVTVIASLGALCAGLASLIKARTGLEKLNHNQHEFIAVAVGKERARLDRWLQEALNAANQTIRELRGELEDALRKLAGCEERDRQKSEQIERLQGQVDGLTTRMDQRKASKPVRIERRKSRHQALP
jgi:DNA repair ATPase RecN